MQLGDLAVAQSIAEALDSQAKWKQLGEMALTAGACGAWSGGRLAGWLELFGLKLRGQQMVFRAGHVWRLELGCNSRWSVGPLHALAPPPLS